MNLPGAYNDLDMRGLRPEWYETVPIEDQKRVIAYSTALRLLWNAKIGKFQVVCREPGMKQEFYDGGFMVGWGICFTWDPPMHVDALLMDLRRCDSWLNYGNFRQAEAAHDAAFDKVETERELVSSVDFNNWWEDTGVGKNFTMSVGGMNPGKQDRSDPHWWLKRTDR